MPKSFHKNFPYSTTWKYDILVGNTVCKSVDICVMYYNVLFSLSASMRLCRASSSKVSKKTRFPGLQNVTLIKTKPTADTADQEKT